MEASIAVRNGFEGRLANQANSDQKVIEMWLHGRPATTRRGYERAARQLFGFVGVGLRDITLADLQAFRDSLGGKESSQGTTLAAVKSLMRFAHDLGYVQFDVSRPLRLPKVKDTLAQRILTEEEAIRVLTLEPDFRNTVLLRVLYASGGRVSEICDLTWADAIPRTDGEGQLTLFGKGGKTRAVILPPETWKMLQKLRGSAEPTDPVFRSRKGGRLDPSQVLRIVRAAGVRAGVQGNVSPHWFRHSHASHALDRGCPIGDVQATLGHASLATTSRYIHARPDRCSSRYLPAV